MLALDVATVLLICLGLVFFVAGTSGMLRFPDVYNRLHAVTKADNLGLGLIAVGLALQADSLFYVLRLALVWWLVLVASTVACHLIARVSLDEEERCERP
jgi:multicomponent Na+:H+ antiporter subunit G